MRRERRRKTTCEHEEGSHGIPEEIMVEILTRLPAKSLLQFRCVCKSWKNLITSPNFISAHLSRISSSSQFRNKNDDSLVILRQQICLLPFDKKNVYSLRRDVEGLPEYRSIDPPPYCFKYGSKMVGSCGGLVCLVDYGCHYGDGPTRLILWNPLLKKCFMLPDPPASHSLDIKRHHFFGFGFDPQSNDFKVVMVVTTKEGNSGVPAKVGIYSLNSRSWKSSFIELGSPLQWISQERPVILNGVVHFLAKQEVHGNKQTFVFTYDPSNDSFDKMMLPWSVAIDFYPKSMCSYDNCLALILLAYKHWEVWVMAEYRVPETWVKKFDFEIKRGLCGAIGFTKNGEMLVERWRTKLDSLNPQTYRIKNLKIEGRRGDFVAFHHVESLVLLDEPYQDVSPKVASNMKNESCEYMARGSITTQSRSTEMGESSKRARQPRQAASFDVDRFTSAENEKWYVEHENNGMIIEKTVDATIDEEFGLSECFERLGWEPILYLLGRYYPHLIKEFYANIQNKSTENLFEISTWVRGVQIHVTEQYLATLLGVPQDGSRMDLKRSGRAVSDPAYDHQLAKEELGLQASPYKGKSAYLTKTLTIQQRLLVYLLSFNVMPRTSGTNEVRTTDIYLLHKLLNGPGQISGVPLVSIIISHMRDVVRLGIDTKYITFPLTVTKILRDKIQVNWRREFHSTPEVGDEIDENKMYTLLYIRYHGAWRNPYTHPLPPGAVPDPRRYPAQEQYEEDLPAPIPTQAESTVDAPRTSETRPHTSRSLQRSIFEYTRATYRDMTQGFRDLRAETASLHAENVRLNERLDAQQQQIDKILQQLQ